MDKLIITAAICGAEVTKEQNPNVPYTVEEIVREAKSAVDAGAAAGLEIRVLRLQHTRAERRDHRAKHQLFHVFFLPCRSGRHFGQT